jgi:hypothetical protein
VVVHSNKGAVILFESCNKAMQATSPLLHHSPTTGEKKNKNGLRQQLKNLFQKFER